MVLLLWCNKPLFLLLKSVLHLAFCLLSHCFLSYFEASDFLMLVISPLLFSWFLWLCSYGCRKMLLFAIDSASW
uniref:Uncharacterized protein n=1 Tax=Manihot esculenta TaxID=3983 RepID=A0A2C9VRM8_MANES